MALQAASPRELAGAVLLSLAFGSVHAFAILMAPLETALDASRSAVSLIYALAIASITTGVFAAPRLLALGIRRMAFLCGFLSALGIAACGAIPSLATAWLGYGIIFGFCNGVAYSLFLARAAAAMPGAPGLAAGIVTAAYGLGAATFALGLDLALEHASLAAVMVGLAAITFVSASVASVLLRDAAETVAANTPPSSPRGAFIAWMWLIYVLGASGGLMAIAHASGLMKPIGAEAIAPSVVAMGNIAGSLGGGVVAGRQARHLALAAPLAIMGAALAALLMLPAAGLVALAAVGLAYGWLISAIPVVVRTSLGDAAFASAFGRVFTAWGLAGLLAPTLAGFLFDRTGGYGTAILVALVAASSGLVIAILGRNR